MLNSIRKTPSGRSQKVTLGSGVIGNATYAIGGVVAASGAIAWALKDDPFYAIIAIAMLVVVYLIYLIGALIYGHLHPVESVLSGSDFVRYHEVVQVAAKDVGELPIIEAIEDPRNATRSPTERSGG